MIFKERHDDDGDEVDGDLDEAALGVDHHRLKDGLLGRQRGSHVTSAPILCNIRLIIIRTFQLSIYHQPWMDES